jgi:tryptophanyl-tRNA synthetase
MNPINELMNLFIRSGKTKFAISFIENLNDLADDLGKLFILGVCFYELGEYESAIKNFSACFKFNLTEDQLDDINFNLGMCYADSMDTGIGLVYLYKVKNRDVRGHIEHINRRHKETQGVQGTGYWNQEVSQHHVHCDMLAKWLVDTLDKGLPTFDFGCGVGFYSDILYRNGFKKVYGFEGEVPKNKIYKKILQQDLTQKFKCKVQGNVICLEVAEHIPKKYSKVFLDNITKPAKDLLIMSWAVRGQMGIGHVNCRNNDEAIEEIESRGFLYNEKLTEQGRLSVSEKCSWFRKSLLVFNRQYPQKVHHIQ